MIRVTSFGSVKSDWRDRYIRLTKKLIPFSWDEISIKRCPDQRTSSLLPEEEKFLESTKNFVLLDVGGKALSSKAFYEFCFKKSECHLVVGPAIGFHPDFFAKAEGSISLSSLTFTHELAQVILAESIFRSACILKNHPFVK
jgi:23S rRNA (pseudouridine1915-N3)-methyltransferase